MHDIATTSCVTSRGRYFWHVVDETYMFECSSSADSINTLLYFFATSQNYYDVAI